MSGGCVRSVGTAVVAAQKKMDRKLQGDRKWYSKTSVTVCKLMTRLHKLIAKWRSSPVKRARVKVYEAKRIHAEERSHVGSWFYPGALTRVGEETEAC